MIITLSPAKTLDYTSPLPAMQPALTMTPIAFPKETERLASAASGLSSDDLAALMHISDKLALMNAERYRNFDGQAERPALFAFAGDVYTGFEAKTLPEEAVMFAQDHVRILSGLYGLLRPLDAMRPYRLEMGTRWAPDQQKDLYGFWGPKIAAKLHDEAQAEGSRTILNLASQEYWTAVEKHRLTHLRPEDVRIITVDFREIGPKGLRFNSFGAKKARGMMARYVCEHRLTDIEAVKQFDSDGYRFDPSGSDDTTWRFIRG